MSKPNGSNVNYYFTWQGQKDSNPRPTVLETGTLPAELYPYFHVPAYDLYIISHIIAFCNPFLKKFLFDGIFVFDMSLQN